ncbi:hypothetical protein ACFW5D_34340 [Streptomyces sp. NPDC058770]|uniref:hypothetical protein n=1 Tax=unclassified Streptomyces TaxID=2593676 RepID=UPI0036C5E0D0
MWKTTKKSTLPQQLRLTDPGVREQLEALPASQVLIGLGTDRQPVGIDLDTDSPHVLVCSTSGGGTSTALRTLAAQVLHHGGDALILDAKRISQPWARGLPGVTYRCDIADIHDALLGLRAEPARHVDEHGETVDLPHLAVVFESAGPAGPPLGQGPPGGRAEDVPGRRRLRETPLRRTRGPHPHPRRRPELQRRTGTRAVLHPAPGTGHPPRTWNQAAPQVAPVPKASTHPGRFHTVQHSTAHPTQVLLMSETEAAAWAAATQTEEH